MKLPKKSAAPVISRATEESARNGQVHADHSPRQEGAAHFVLGLVHQKNGNLIQARNCFLQSLCVADPHPGGEYKLIEVHRKIVQRTYVEEEGKLDRDAILQALGVCGDPLSVKMYLAELSLREGDFHAAMEQVAEYAMGDPDTERQILAEISTNLFSECPAPDHPGRLLVDIWRAALPRREHEQQRIVTWLKKFDEIPGEFIRVGDRPAVLRAALDRVQLGKNLSFVGEQLLFGLGLTADLGIFVIESGEPDGGKLVGHLLQIDESEAVGIGRESLIKLREICEGASAAEKNKGTLVLLQNLVQIGRAEAMPFISLSLQAITSYCHRMVSLGIGASGKRDNSNWTADLTALIENMLLLEKKDVSIPLVAEVVSPLFQCLLAEMTTPKLGHKTNFAGRLAPFLREDEQGSVVFRSLAETNPEFIRLCRKSSQGILFS